ncbi:MAG TPA: FAD-binding oxidoreductase [Burkholderiales bacterium]|nr:FAD-binding oxidoreductase [Burkholderiales bacterium]
MPRRRDFLRLAALAWPAAALGQAKKPEGIPVNDMQGQLSGTLVSSIVTPDSLEGVQGALKLAQGEDHALCVSGGRHSMGSQAFAAEGLLVDTRKLSRVLALDNERGLVEVESGMQWPELLDTLHQTPWAFHQKQSGVDRVTIGGSLSANMHGNALGAAPFVADIESFKLLNAKGALVNCGRAENADLFRLAIGGYGLFGFVYSVTLRLVRRRKLERVAELRTIDGLASVFADRMREGFVAGEFHLNPDELSPDFLRRGVFVGHRPVGDERPMPEVARELGEADWRQLMFLAHTEKSNAFRRYADFCVATSGQLYWSDDVQMAHYPENYHRDIDRRVGGRGSDVLTEIYCEREKLEAFVSEVRSYALRARTDFIAASVRLIEADNETYIPWARQPYACVTLNVHVDRTSTGLIRASDALRAMIDIGLRYGGSYSLAYHRYALRRQIDACYPKFGDFLRLKRRYDPTELFQSDWYRGYKKMYFG